MNRAARWILSSGRRVTEHAFIKSRAVTLAFEFSGWRPAATDAAGWSLMGRLIATPDLPPLEARNRSLRLDPWCAGSLRVGLFGSMARSVYGAGK